jgi:D-alanine-D-alanine ligase
MVYDRNLNTSLTEAILQPARAAWRAVGIRGYGRVDVRLNSDGTPVVLEVNPNPDLTPGGGIHRAAKKAGWTWEQFIGKQIEWALSSASL